MIDPQGLNQLGRRLADPLRSALRRVGYDVVRYLPPPPAFAADFEPEEIEDLQAVRPYTLTSPDRMVALIRAVRHLAAHKIPGAMVECGVWKGGSMMLTARTLLRAGDTTRDLYLFDTFEGMSRPTGVDVALNGEIAMATWEKDQQDRSAEFTNVPLEQVRKALASVGYPQERIHFVKGKVEDTVPRGAPEAIALLRLDTDWYESTMHELVHLYPRLARGGVLIIDDYGHWQGARRATDEYLQKHGIPMLLQRMDYTGRMGVKP
jgi:hypothetical protein